MSSDLEGAWQALEPSAEATERARVAVVAATPGRRRLRWPRRARRGVVALAFALLILAGAATAAVVRPWENISGPESAPPPSAQAPPGGYTAVDTADGPLKVPASAVRTIDTAQLTPVGSTGPFVALTGKGLDGASRCILVVSRENPDYTSQGCVSEDEVAASPQWVAFHSDGTGFFAAMVAKGATKVTVNGALTHLRADAFVVPYKGGPVSISVESPSGASAADLPAASSTR
jgi:hypothetical protein